MSNARESASADYLTPPEIASLLGVDHAKILAWIRSGELRGVDLSTNRIQRPRYKVSRSELEDFLRRRTTTPARKPIRRRRQTQPSEENYY